jgi:hypothetical protein
MPCSRKLGSTVSAPTLSKSSRAGPKTGEAGKRRRDAPAGDNRKACNGGILPDRGGCPVERVEHPIDYFTAVMQHACCSMTWSISYLSVVAPEPAGGTRLRKGWIPFDPRSATLAMARTSREGMLEGIIDLAKHI